MPSKVANNIIAVDQNASLTEASELIRDNNIHHLVVTGDGEVKGLISDRDILDGWVRGAGVALDKIKVSDCYRKDIPIITPSTSVKEAVATMQSGYTNALLVDAEGTFGIVSTIDLLESLASKTDPNTFDFAKLTFADPMLQKIMKTLSDIGI